MNESTIDCQSITLRPMSESFVTEKYLSWLGDPQVTKAITHTTQDFSELKNYVNSRVKNPNTRFWAICSKSNNEHIGNIKLEPIDWSNGVCSFGIMIGDKNYWGKGVASETTAAVVKHAFGDLGLKRVELGVVANNERALKVYEKVGFKVKEVLPKSEIINGESHDVIMMAIDNTAPHVSSRTIFPGTYSAFWRRLLGLLFNNSVFQNSIPDTLHPRLTNFSIQEFNQSKTDLKNLNLVWKNQLEAVSFHTPYLRFFDPHDLKINVLQHLVCRLDSEYSFAKLSLKAFPESNLQFFIAAPAAIRKTLKEHGIPVAEFGSRLIWLAFLTNLFKQALISNFKTSLQIVRDSFSPVPSRKVASPVAIWINLTEPLQTDSETKLSILEFLKEKKLKCLQGNLKVFIGNHSSRIPSQATENVYCGRDPFAFPNPPSLSLFLVARQIFIQMQTVTSLIISFVTNRWWDLLLAKDFSELPRIVPWYQTVRPKHILQSNATNPDPVWTLLQIPERAQTWWVLYSTNCRPLQFKTETEICDYPLYLNLLSDHIVVWNEEQAAWLSHLGFDEKRIEITGPIIFGKYPEKLVRSKDQKFKIAVFDVTPVTPDLLAKIGFGDIYYRMDIVESFLNDILGSCQEVFGKENFEIVYKAKRKPISVHHSKYWQLLEKLSEDSAVQLLPPEINPLFAVRDTQAVISLPFSSPTLLGQYYGIPAVFYDPTGELADNPFTANVPKLIGGKQNLVNWLQKLKEEHS